MTPVQSIAELNGINFKKEEVPAPQIANCELVKEDTPMRVAFKRLVCKLATKPFARVDYSEQSPNQLFEGIKQKAEKLIDGMKRLSNSPLKTLPDILKAKETVRRIKQGESLTVEPLRQLGQTSRYELVFKALENRFAGNKKVVLQLYPFEYPKQLAEKEDQALQSLQTDVDQLVKLLEKNQTKFRSDDLTIPQALDLIKEVSRSLQDPAALKDLKTKIDANLKLIQELKYRAPEKQKEEDTELFERVSSMWKFFQFMLSNNQTIENAFVYYSVMKNITSQLSNFEGEMQELDTNNKQIKQKLGDLVAQISENRDKIKLSFVDQIQAELKELEEKIRALSKPSS